MATLIDQFKALPLAQMGEMHRLICEAYEEAKRARLVALEAEIRQLGFTPGEAKHKPAAVKYRSKANPSLGWAGRGQYPAWLKKEMQETGLPVDAFKV